MNKKVVLILLTLFIASYILISMDKRKETRLCFKDNCFKIELALTSEEKKQGLMFRDHLEENKGMLFVFLTEKKHSFWMKNTLIPLDIIWINENKEVVFISKNNQPCQDNECPTIEPGRKAKYVLELNGGTTDKINLKIGDKANFDL